MLWRVSGKLGWAAICGWLLIGIACTSKTGRAAETGIDKNIKRACLTIREINWAGSMRNDGYYDPDDDFIELQNSDCGIPMDLTGFQISLRGQVTETFVVPKGEKNIVAPNGVVIIAGKTKGAFADIADILLPGFRLPEQNFIIETHTRENFLMENGINRLEGLPLAGGYDGISTRSMERTEDRFDEEGGGISTWHSFTPCNERRPSGGAMIGSACRDDDKSIGNSGTNVSEAYSSRTFASPGEINTPDYR